MLFETDPHECNHGTFIQVKVFWFVTLYSVVVKDFRGPCCLHLHFTSPSRGRQHGLLKNWYPTTTWHGIINQKTSTLNLHHCENLHSLVANLCLRTVYSGYLVCSRPRYSCYSCVCPAIEYCERMKWVIQNYGEKLTCKTLYIVS